MFDSKKARRSITVVLASLIAMGSAIAAQAGTDSNRSMEGDAARPPMRSHSASREHAVSQKQGQLKMRNLRQQRETGTEGERLASGGQADPEALARRAQGRQYTLNRQLQVGPKVGQLERDAIRDDLNSLDTLIGKLERNEDVDPRAVEAALGVMIAKAPMSRSEKLQQSEAQLATYERQLSTGPKVGAARRAAIRSEIESLDTMIEQLEGQGQGQR